MTPAGAALAVEAEVLVKRFGTTRAVDGLDLRRAHRRVRPAAMRLYRTKT